MQTKEKSNKDKIKTEQDKAGERRLANELAIFGDYEGRIAE